MTIPLTLLQLCCIFWSFLWNPLHFQTLFPIDNWLVGTFHTIVFLKVSNFHLVGKSRKNIQWLFNCRIASDHIYLHTWTPPYPCFPRKSSHSWAMSFHFHSKRCTIVEWFSTKWGFFWLRTDAFKSTNIHSAIIMSYE